MSYWYYTQADAEYEKEYPLEIPSYLIARPSFAGDDIYMEWWTKIEGDKWPDWSCLEVLESQD